MIHRRTMLRGDCPAVVRRGLEASRRAYTTPSLSFSPLFPSLPREREKREEEGYILVPVGMGAFRISDIKADTASIPLKYHASVASTRDFSSPRWRRQSLSGSSTEITSKRVNSLAVVATSIRGEGEKENAFLA